jgi:S-formylglutathione hydrolase FrmB
VAGLGVVLTVALVGASINAYYDYFPTLGALLGRNAADEISSAHLHELEKAAARPGYRHGMDHGVVVAFRIPGTVSHFHARTGQVYLPAAYFQSPRPRLRVIELLHGSPGSPADWTRGGMADLTADAYAKKYNTPAPLIVMPDVNGGWWKDTECVNGVRGNAETYLTIDVRNAVVARFHVARAGAFWAVGGLSEGGTCALILALRHPNFFAAAADFSGDPWPWVKGGLAKLFAGRPTAIQADIAAYDPRTILASWRRYGHGPAIWLSVGRGDPSLSLPTLESFRAEVVRDGLTDHVATVGGLHSFRVWRQSFEVGLPWLMDWMRAPQPSRSALIGRPEVIKVRGRVAAGSRLTPTSTKDYRR